MNVRDVMSSNLVWCEEGETVENVAKLMRDNHIGCIPVLKNNELQGLLTDRDITTRVVAFGLNPGNELAGDYMTKDNLLTVAPETPVEEASRIMARNKIRRLPVIENNMCVGVISLGDMSLSEEKELAGETLKEISEPTMEERVAA